jgi:hypothetical protein
VRRLALSLALLGCRTPPAPPTAPRPAEAPRAPPDRDADGVPDPRDACPDEPEDRDGFADADGCVDRDNDGDGVPDAHELRDGRWTNCDRALEGDVEVDCRDLPETRDGVRDHDGCPERLCMDQCQRRLSTRVRLDPRGRLAAGAARDLDEIAAVLAAAPDLQVLVAAHLDARRDGAAAQRLTARIAGQVVAELVRRGVARERMEPIGWGDRQPIDRNTTAEGRAHNRRVDLEVKLDACCRPLGAPPAPAAGLDCR